MLQTFLSINSLSNVSDSGYRNHIQKYTLQERVKFGHVTDHADFMMGGRNRASPQAKMISNWSTHQLGGVQKPSLKTQDTIKLSLLLLALSATAF